MYHLKSRAGLAILLSELVTQSQNSPRSARALAVRLLRSGTLPFLLPLCGALAIWVACLRRIDPNALSDVGLASALPYAAWLPYALLSAGFFFVVGQQPRRRWLAYLYLVALALMLHGTPAIDYGTLRYPWAWKHLGIIDYVERHGAVNQADPILGAYHNWPGFFAAAAFIAEIAEIRDLAAPARWAPLAFNLLYLAALPMLYRSLTRDHRVILGGAWVFLTGNWIGQDYFSPQATAFLFYLVLLGLCLRFLAHRHPRTLTGGSPMRRAASDLAQWLVRGLPNPPALPNGASRAIVTAAVLLLILAITATHQLTPLFEISALGMLAAFHRLGIGPFLFAGVLLVAWVLYFATPFVAIVLPIEIQELGVTVSRLTDDLLDTSAISPGHAFVSLVCRSLTLAIAVAALAGGIRRVTLGYRDGLAAALAAAPLLLLAVTAYGGEIIFRVYLFALPFLAFFAAALLFASPRRECSAKVLAGASVFGFALAVAFVFANNGKDRQYAFTPEDIAAVQWLDETAPEGTLLIEGARLYPAQFRNYEHFTYVSLADEPPRSRADVLADPTSVLARWMDTDTYRAAFIILTRNQKAYVDALRIMPPGAFDRMERALLASPRFRLVHAGGGTMIFTLNEAVHGMGEWIH